MIIASATVEPFETPLHSPFVTSQGSATAAKAVAVELTLEDGRTARGESVPVTYVTGESIDSVLATAGPAANELVGMDATRYRPMLSSIAAAAAGQPSARCGMEMAALSAWSLATGVSLWKLWGGAQESAETDLTIPIVPNGGDLAAVAWSLGVRIFKLKVGHADVEQDHARVDAVRRAAPEARIRLDANQAFKPDGAIRFVDRLLSEGANLEMLEQPVKKEDIEALEEVARRSPVPVFADESCQTPAQAMRLAAGPVQGFNLKLNKCGIQGALEILPIARAAGKRLMLGCMLETRHSIAVSLAFACAAGVFEFLDLDSPLLLNEPGENPYFLQEGSVLTLLPRITGQPAT